MDIAVGQVWTLRDAAAETARVVIQKIEPCPPVDEAVHVSLYGLPEIPGRFMGVITHMPFSRTAVEASLDRLTVETPPGDVSIAEGYRDWQENKGGIFTITIAQAAQYVLDVSLAGRLVE